MLSQGSHRKSIKYSGLSFPYSFILEMLEGAFTLLVLLLSSYTLGENLSESCGCTIETVESINNQRIPTRLTERYCYQPGAPCVSDNYRVSSFTRNKYHQDWIPSRLNTFRNNTNKNEYLQDWMPSGMNTFRYKYLQTLIP